MNTSNMFKLDFHVGQVASVNTDATIDIFDYKVGSVLYKNIKIDHTASDIQQPMVGHYVLYFTVTIGARETQVKIVRFYGNEISDINKVLPDGVTDIQAGEHKMLSATGASVYLANGSAFLGSIGQSIIFDDDTMYCNVKCKNLKITTLNGCTIEQTGDTLTIKKGVYDPTTGTVPFPLTTVTVSGSEVSIDSPTVSINSPVVSIGDDASKGVVRVNDSCGYLYFYPGVVAPGGGGYTNPPTLTYGTSPTPPVTIPLSTAVQVQAQEGSLTVTAAD
jgi:hypothetical protein